MFKHKTTAAKVTAELNIHLKDYVSTRTVRREQSKHPWKIWKPSITEINAKIRKRWRNNHETWIADNWEKVIWSDISHRLYCFQQKVEFMYGEFPRKPTIWTACFRLSNMEVDP